MKYVFSLLLGCLVLSCSSPRNLEEIKQDYGSFAEGETIKLIEADYRKTPIAHKVEHHPELFTYLEDVEIYSMAHLSDGLFITGYVVQPKQPGTYPCIVYNRGGNGDLGQLIMATAVEQMALLASHGYVVVASNYRGTTYSEGKDEFGGKDVNDVLNLIESLSDLEKADTSKIGLFGISRGGMMNYLVSKTLGDKIDAVITIGGISDLEMTMKYHPQITDVCIERIPNFETNRKAECAARSAIEWTEELSSKTAFLILHGKDDTHVKYDQAEALSNRMKSLGMTVQFKGFEAGSHGLSEHRKEVMKLCASWLEKYL
ncbi:MAG: prolyl oligopeptidase family serine peptidase [Flavobacteriales bacterium]|nr:prolyl oligopeptidase family serine peptidase [Flavobacteriales bacterium]